MNKGKKSKRGMSGDPFGLEGKGAGVVVPADLPNRATTAERSDARMRNQGGAAGHSSQGRKFHYCSLLAVSYLQAFQVFYLPGFLFIFVGSSMLSYDRLAIIFPDIISPG
jgi:hypothetical protein